MPDSILIIDDVASSRSQIRGRLSVAQYKVLTASSAAEGLELASSNLPSIVLAGLGLADMAGEDLIRKLRAIPGLARVGIIGIRPEQSSACLSSTLGAGADDVLDRPLDEVALMSIVRSLVRRQRRSAAIADRMTWAGLATPGLADAHHVADHNLDRTLGSVALITDNRPLAAIWKAAVRHGSTARLVVVPISKALRFLERVHSTDVVLIDVSQVSFRRAVAEIADVHSRLAARHAELVAVTADGDVELAAVARDMGASDAISTQISTNELIVRLRTVLNRKRLQDYHRDQINESLKLAAYDPLTGLTNRRTGLFRVERMLTEAGADGTSLAILALDVDDFKNVNDRFGHSAGDTVLIAVADRIRSLLRGVDLFARTGGDEFIMALPSMTQAGARHLADHIRHLVATTPIRLPGNESVSVTVSVGVVVSSCDGSETASGLIHAADRDMYRAKAEQRHAQEGTVFRAPILRVAAAPGPADPPTPRALPGSFRRPV